MRLVGKTCQRRVRAHGTDGLFTFGCDRAQDHAQILVGVTEGPLSPKQGLGIGVVHARGLGQLIDGDLVRLQPLGIGLARGQILFDFSVGNDAACDGIHQKHLAWLQSALFLDLLGSDIEHACFGSHDDQSIVRHDIPAGTKAVAIERRPDYATVGESNRRGAIPGFHHAGVVLVESALLRLHVRVAGPGLGNQHGHYMRQAASGL